MTTTTTARLAACAPGCTGTVVAVMTRLCRGVVATYRCTGCGAVASVKHDEIDAGAFEANRAEMAWAAVTRLR